MIPKRFLVHAQLAALVLLTVPTFAKNNTHVVVVPVANMYSKPTEKSDVVSQAIYGSNVRLLEARGEWSRIQTPDRYKGWTPSRYLRIVLAGDGYASAGRTVQVESLFANVYAEPDVTKHKPVITVPFATRLEIAKDSAKNAGKPEKSVPEGWQRVRLPGQTTAWIQTGDVISDPKRLSIPEAIELAKHFLGIPYLWGGTSSFGFDCSGFTQMLVRARGINMPRDADQQAAWNGVMVVKRDDLQAGDLLFFGPSAKDITHTGMYIGDGQFIHDTINGHPVVQISKLDDEPWTKLLVACRRVKAIQ
jgi:gamma-D-glutamyl-L-lysine dipeptidyl-peptidase